MQVRIVGALLVALVSGLFIAGWGKTLGEAAKIPAGLSASDWNSIRAEYERNRHAAFQVGGEYRARNAQQQWLTHFDGRGFIVELHSNCPMLFNGVGSTISARTEKVMRWTGWM